MRHDEWTDKSKRARPIGEPALAALLNDPMTQLLMAADGVAQHELEWLLQKARARLCLAVDNRTAERRTKAFPKTMTGRAAA